MNKFTSSEQQIEKKNIFKSFNTKIVSLVSEKQWRLSKKASKEEMRLE